MAHKSKTATTQKKNGARTRRAKPTAVAAKPAPKRQTAKKATASSAARPARASAPPKRTGKAAMVIAVRPGGKARHKVLVPVYDPKPVKGGKIEVTAPWGQKLRISAAKHERTVKAIAAKAKANRRSAARP